VNAGRAVVQVSVWGRSGTTEKVAVADQSKGDHFLSEGLYKCAATVVWISQHRPWQIEIKIAMLFIEIRPIRGWLRDYCSTGLPKFVEVQVGRYSRTTIMHSVDGQGYAL